MKDRILLIVSGILAAAGASAFWKFSGRLGFVIIFAIGAINLGAMLFGKSKTLAQRRADKSEVDNR